MSKSISKSRTKLADIRINAGWSVNQLAASSKVCAATLKRAEQGLPVRDYIWGKILQGVNSLQPKGTHRMSDIRT
jgi:transcriptional regulator with XRE-family HTH domain